MQKAQRRWHARLWMIVGLGLPIAFLALMALRQTTPLERPAVLVEPPGQNAASQAGAAREAGQ